MYQSQMQKQIITQTNPLKQESQQIETDPSLPKQRKEQIYQNALRNIEALSPELRTQWDDLINNHPWVKND